MRTTNELNKQQYVGVGALKSAHTSKARQNKGITLIALIITIIVMLILVAVTINMAIKGNLFGNAGKAAGDMQNAIDKEKSLANGGIKIGDKYYTIDEYLEQIGNNNNRIKLTYTITPAEDNLSAVIKVNARLLGGLLADGEELQTYEEYALEKLEGKTDEEIEQIFVDGQNYWNEIEDWGEPTYANIDQLVAYWSENYAEGRYDDVDGMVADNGYNSLAEFAIDWWNVYPEGYNFEEYENYLGDMQLNMMDPAGRVHYNTNTLEYTVYRDGKYTFIASNESGTASNSITVKIDNIYEEKFSEIYKENTPITQGSYTAVIPKGFAVGISEGINKIETGLVITDAVDSEEHSVGNEFVWIPVTSDLGSSYSYSSYSEPEELTSTWSGSTNETKPQYDSQEILDELYGKNYYNYAEDFKYADEYAEMVEKVNENDGFYIGRYETTIDDNGSIGSKYSTTVLTAGTRYTNNSTTYYYRWYGLYYAQKNANVTGNGTDVQTAMIYGVLWNKAMEFIRTQKAAGKTTYNVDSATDAWHGSSNGHTGVVKSGLANPGMTGDVALNIWDLESNAGDWTQASSSTTRVARGDNYHSTNRASFWVGFGPDGYSTSVSSRLALYIK